MTTLADKYDCLLLDLDGTVFRGHEATEGAVDALARVPARKLYVTNNASRAADEVATHLQELGFPADADDIVTSSQSAARLLASQLDSDAAVLVIGTDALAAEIAAVGLRPVRNFDDGPVAVVQGHSTSTGWSDLAEAALAIRAGAVWVAANVDKTLPTERGLMPGNGSMVAALRTATDAEPQVAGKPAPTLMSDALMRGSFEKPLVIGDRLDTDIAGAVAADLPSLMVLTGVSTAAEAAFAIAAERPTYIGLDLRALHEDPAVLLIAEQPAWDVALAEGTLTVTATGQRPADDGLSIVRAVAHALTAADGHGAPHKVAAGDTAAEVALRRWSLLSASDRLA
ncbi:MAG: HAD-IIA family hydrolase [Mycobacterium sp.]